MSSERVKNAQRTVDDYFKNSRFNRRKENGLINDKISNLSSFESTSTLSRQSSILSSVADNEDDAFEETGNRSFDTSTEVVNTRSLAFHKGPNGSATSSTTKTTLKRGIADILDNMQPRKISKTVTPPPVASADGTIQLSEEQQRVIDLVLSKKSLFFTGSAGTGKSVVLKELVKRCTAKYGDSFGLTASTGMAACNIGGQTLHRFLGIGLALQSAEVLAKKINKSPMLQRRWMTLRLLIIDEISMIDCALFDKLEKMARDIRGSSAPFGGIQVVACGDFYQLPPVDNSGRPVFCFMANSWKKVIKNVVMLKQVFRQKGDNQFIQALNNVRTGSLDEGTIQLFSSLNRKVAYEDGLEPTELYPTLHEVNSANKNRLSRLPGNVKVFRARDEGDNYLIKLLNNLMVEQELQLKVGAQVMMVKNQSDTIVNGSLGTVLMFCTRRLYINFVDHFGYIDASDSESIEVMKLICERIGQYISFTPEESEFLARLPLKTQEFIGASCYIAQLETESSVLPLVLFGKNDVILVEREEFKLEKVGTSQNKTLVREQLPLILAWAMSIHKAQGQTLKRLKINVGKSFAAGQIYVALSRATSRDQLEVINFNPKKVQTSVHVKNFYKEME